MGHGQRLLGRVAGGGREARPVELEHHSSGGRHLQLGEGEEALRGHGHLLRRGVRARAEVMFENYATTLSVEVETLINMIETGILPACAKDMAKYATMPALSGDRLATYTGIKTETDKLKQMFEKKPHDLQ